MLPDQWPAAIQEDVERVRAAVVNVQSALLQDIATDIQAVRVAVEAVRVAVENTALRDVWINAYTTSGASNYYFYVSMADVVTIQDLTGNRVSLIVQGRTSGLRVNLSFADIKTRMQAEGIRFIDAPSPGAPMRWWSSASRAAVLRAVRRWMLLEDSDSETQS